MDGTLVETEEYWGEAMFTARRRLGGRMSAEARAATVGTSMRMAMGILYADLGVTRTEEQLQADVTGHGRRRPDDDRAADLAARRAGAADRRARGRPAHRPGDDDAAPAGRPGDRAHRGRLSRRRPFDVTVCGDEVPARKPDPAPYLQAMAALGVRRRSASSSRTRWSASRSGLAAGCCGHGRGRRCSRCRRRPGSCRSTPSTASACPSWPTCWPAMRRRSRLLDDFCRPGPSDAMTAGDRPSTSDDRTGT